MPITLAELIQAYGITGALIVYIFIRDVLPFLRDKLYPDIQAGRKAERVDAKKREDRLFDMMEASITSSTKLQSTLQAMELTLGAMGAQLEQQAQTQGAMMEDLSGLYGKLNVERPSRERRNRIP